MTGASGETAVTFRVACSVAKSVDTTLASEICADLVAAASADGQSVESVSAPLATGPGLEILVEKATPQALEVTPTWVDASGARMTQPRIGLRIVDRTLNDSLRRNFFARILANPPR